MKFSKNKYFLDKVIPIVTLPFALPLHSEADAFLSLNILPFVTDTRSRTWRWKKSMVSVYGSSKYLQIKIQGVFFSFSLYCQLNQWSSWVYLKSLVPTGNITIIWCLLQCPGLRPFRNSVHISNSKHLISLMEACPAVITRSCFQPPQEMGFYSLLPPLVSSFNL